MDTLRELESGSKIPTNLINQESAPQTRTTETTTTKTTTIAATTTTQTSSDTVAEIVRSCAS